MAEILIIADDLTGAIEAGVQLSKHKISVLVVLDFDTDLKFILKNKKMSTVVVNSESRHISSGEAAKRILQILKSVEGYNIKWFYKKTDSTMRGNIGAELEAFLFGTNQTVLPYIPAHPKLKRYTREGFQYIDKVLLHQTAFANDPHEPVKNSSVLEILRKQTNVKIILADPAGLTSSETGADGNKILVFNCQSETDLTLIGKTILKNNLQKAISGTAGFVEILPRILPFTTSEINLKSAKSPILFINGSLNVASLKQVNFAKEKGVKTFFLTPEIISSDNFIKSVEYNEMFNKIRNEFKNGRDVIISTNEKKYINKTIPLKEKEFVSYSELAGRFISSLINEIDVSTLCVFGGDTLMEIMKAIGCESIEAGNEIIQGVAYSVTDANSGRISLFSKPGGYGEKDIILKIINTTKHSVK